MLIEIKQVIPEPIPHDIIERSEIWGRDLIFESGSFVLISAQSGMGKSTLLHILYGLRQDYAGDITINQESIRAKNWLEWEAWRRQIISLLFQDLRLFPSLSARQNIELIPQLNSSLPSIQEMADRLGMKDFLDQSVITLSHGQRQRVALLRALRKPFKLLLLDEPFSHLDQENQSHACALIEEITKANQAGLVLSSLGAAPSLPFDQTFSL